MLRGGERLLQNTEIMQSSSLWKASNTPNRPIQSRGLKRIPEFVLKSLTPEQRRQLSENGHGLSFPCKSGCQMRLIKDGQDLGGFYSYRQFGSIAKAVQAAMNKNRHLKVAIKSQPGGASKSEFVYFVNRFDKRKGKTEYRYQVSYRKNGKVANKAFSLGHAEPSADKLLHAYLTAKLFRFYYEELGEDFDESCFKRWKHTRLYLPGEIPFNWENS